jgi:hypothetical protein
MGHIILGLFIIAAGVGLVMKSEWMLNNFGRIAFFEKYLGLDGGTRLGYKIIGLIFIFIGTLITFGLIDSFLKWSLSPLINAGNRGSGNALPE